MKISASIASAWWRGQKEEALAMINGESIDYPLIQEKAFSFGHGAHKAWEAESKLTEILPVIFKVPKLKVVGTEVKLYKQLNEKDWLSGVIDAVALGEVNNEPLAVMVDYKTGSKSDRWQSCVYHYLAHDSEWWRENVGELDPMQFWYLTMDKLSGQTHSEIIKLTMPQTQAEWELPDATTYTTGFNFIMTVLTEIKDELGIE